MADKRMGGEIHTKHGVHQKVRETDGSLDTEGHGALARSLHTKKGIHTKKVAETESGQDTEGHGALARSLHTKKGVHTSRWIHTKKVAETDGGQDDVEGHVHLGRKATPIGERDVHNKRFVEPPSRDR
jgi:hypothetical protein